MESWLFSFSTFLAHVKHTTGVDVVLTQDLLVVLIQVRIAALMAMADVKAEEDKAEEVANEVSWFDPTLLPYPGMSLDFQIRAGKQ